MTWFTVAFSLLALLITLTSDLPPHAISSMLWQLPTVGLPSVWLFFLMPGIHITWRWMRFVRVAEDVFRTFGWQDVERIDLCKSSRNSKGPDVFGYGALYYKY